MAQYPIEEALCFDDVLLVPGRFEGSSRSQCSLKTTVAGLDLDLCIVSANMPSVTEESMCIQLGDMGGLGILHRMQSPEQMFDMAFEVRKQLSPSKRFGGSIGIGPKWKDEASSLVKAGADIVCIDVAHGDQISVFEVFREFRNIYRDFPLIVGNFATPRSFPDYELGGYGNLSYKLGVGSGASCSTRIATGCGLPTFESVRMARLDNLWYNTIADGGIKNSGDIVKSLAAGASAAMLGKLLAGTSASPGTIHRRSDGHLYKSYRGNASYGTKKDHSGNVSNIEGVETEVRYSGKLEDVIEKLCQGIRSGMSYVGALTIQELQEKAEFVKISQSGFKESTPHGLL